MRVVLLFAFFLAGGMGTSALGTVAPTWTTGECSLVNGTANLKWDHRGPANQLFYVRYQCGVGGRLIKLQSRTAKSVTIQTNSTDTCSFWVKVGLKESQKLTLEPLSPPARPYWISGTALNQQVTLRWLDSNESSKVTDYTVRYSSDNGASWNTFPDEISTAKTATVTGLIGGTSYIFGVAAKNAAGTGGYSLNSPAVTPYTTPGAPTGVTAVPGNTQVVLAWTAPDKNGGNAITDYVVQYQLASGGAWTTFADEKSTSTSAVVTGLMNSTAYIFKVAAVNAGGTGSYSSNSAAVTPYTTPGAPTGVTAVPGNTQVALNWSQPGNGRNSITNYAYRFSSDNGASWSAEALTGSSSASYIITGLMNGTAYIFKVAAVNAGGTGSYSSNSAAVTPYTTPGAPPGVTAVPGNTQVALNWSQPADDGGGTITDYVIEYSNSSGVRWTTFRNSIFGSLSATVTGLTNDISYIFRVAAVNAGGSGSYSYSSAVVPLPGRPGSPANLMASAGARNIFLAWVAPAGYTRLGSAFYEIEQTRGNSSDWVTVSKTFASSITLYFDTPGSYRFRVRAVSYLGRGDYSSETGQLTPQFPSPSTNSPMSFISLKTKDQRQTPCDPEAGEVGPDQGSGMCTGNYLTTLDIPYFGQFIYNSHRSGIDLGYGLGFDLAQERRIIKDNSTNTFFLEQGDGTRIPLMFYANLNSTTKEYFAQDIRRNINIFTVNTDEASEISPEGVKIRYRRSIRLQDAYEIFSVMEPNGESTNFVRDSEGRLSSIIDPHNQSIQIGWSSGHVSSLTDTAGNTYSVSFNEPGIDGGYYLKEIRSDNDNSFLWKLAYDGNGRLNSATDFQGAVESVIYDDQGRANTITNSNNYLTSLSYTSTSVKFENALSFKEETLENNRVSSIKNRPKTTNLTRFTRDNQGRVSSVVLPNLMTLNISYKSDVPGDLKSFYLITRIERVNGSARKTQSFNYDCNSSNDNACDLISETNEDGVTTTYSGYSNHLPGRISFNNQTISFVYDLGVRRPTLIQTDFGSIQRTYNSDGSLASETDISGQRTTFDYDLKGRLTRTTDHFGRTTDMRYDNLGRLTQATDPTRSIWSNNYSDVFGRSFSNSLSVANGAFGISYSESTRIDPSTQKVINVESAMTIGNDSVSRKQSFDTNNGYQTGNGETMQTPFSNGAFTTRDTRNQGVSYGDGASN